MDVDGTLTDGKIYMSATGEMLKAFNVKDGYGIHDILIPHRITPVVITGRTSLIVEQRCNELGIINLFQGVKEKKTVLTDFLKSKCCGLNQIAYIGDDLNDINCAIAVAEAHGLVGCPADAIQEIKSISNYICRKNGGDGAVREYIEWVMKTQN